MKLLSVVIPSYNSEEYMRFCIESLLVGGDKVELLIVNDGSRDNTGNIADEYMRKYPTIVRAIHQENGGHGEAVNTGIRHATGKYFKVVDSDDWVDVRAYLKILDELTRFEGQDELVDMVISNFVYENADTKRKKVMKFDNVLPEGRVFTWDDIKTFRKGQYLLMHAVIYRTQLLRYSGLVLPKHTFYVDNLYVYTPMEFVENIYYINVDFYRYFIGREDQSVQENIMIERVDQQLKVNKMMIHQINIDQLRSEKLQDYLLRHLEIVTMVSSILLIRSGTAENLAKRRALWRYIKEEDSKIYRKLRYGVMGNLTSLSGRFVRVVPISVYKIAQRIVGFN